MLFTRAREKCTIVTNFSCDDLDNKISIAKNTSPGINDFREFLYYAKYREMSEKGSRNPVFESPFEESVYDFLASKGYDIDTQVGAGNFRIDLAIKDKRPDASTRYLIAFLVIISQAISSSSNETDSMIYSSLSRSPNPVANFLPILVSNNV